MFKQRSEELEPEIRDFLEKVSRKVKRLRTETGVGQDEFAFNAGLHRTHIGQIENDGLDLRLSTVYKLAKALNLEVSELLELD